MTSTLETRNEGRATVIEGAAAPVATAALDARAPRLRVVVADDHPLYREGIVRALDAAGMLVVAEAGDGDIALAQIREHQPDVALLDVTMPGLDGIDVVAVMARQALPVAVVLLSAFDDPALVRAGLHAGAATYVSKTADRATIIDAVAEAGARAKAPGALVGPGNLLRRDRHDRIPRLTLQECRVLQYARDGLSKQQMATRLGVDERGVRGSLSSAIDKLGADTLPQAVDIAVRAGVLHVPSHGDAPAAA